MLDQIGTIEGHLEEMALKMQRMEAQGIATGEATEEISMILGRVDQRALLISDRVAESNVLLTQVAESIVESNRILSAMVPAGSASAAVRRSFSSVAASASSPHQSAASPSRTQHQ